VLTVAVIAVVVSGADETVDVVVNGFVDEADGDVAVDVEYRMELRRREALPGYPAVPAGTLAEANQEIVKSAEHPMFIIPKQTRDPKAEKAAVQSCLDLKSRVH